MMTYISGAGAMEAKERPVCPVCIPERPMHKAGFTWSGRNRRQVWRCQKCGRTTIKERPQP